MTPVKQQYLREEIQYLLDNDFIEPSQSDWSIDDCIDNIGHAKYVTKFHRLKGFWQIPLTDRAKEISAFVTTNGIYQYKVAFWNEELASNFSANY